MSDHTVSEQSLPRFVKCPEGRGEWARTAELSGRGVPSSAQRFITANISSSISDSGKYEILCFDVDITFLSRAQISNGAFGTRTSHEDHVDLSQRHFTHECTRMRILDASASMHLAFVTRYIRVEATSTVVRGLKSGDIEPIHRHHGVGGLLGTGSV